MLKLFAKLLKALNSETEPGQLSLAFCMAMIAGLTPVFSLHNLVVLLLVLIIRANLSVFILAFVFFSGTAYLLDPLFHKIGLLILSAQPLQNTWTAMYNNVFWIATGFNNTILMGSLLFSLMLFIPFYFMSNFLIKKYRDHVLKLVQNSKTMNFIKATKFYGIYEKIACIRGI